MPGPTVTFKGNGIGASSETNIGKIALSSQTGASKYPLIYNYMTATSSTGCLDFTINIYKNGTLTFSKRTGTTSTTAPSWFESPIDLVIEYGGNLLVTATNNVAASTNSFTVVLENR